MESGIWGYTEKEGVYTGRSFLAIYFQKHLLAEKIAKITEALQASDWYPMIRATGNRDLQGFGDAYVVELWSESDSLPFLAARFDHAIVDLESRIRSALGINHRVVIADSEQMVLKLLVQQVAA